jgi:hypothetical protein
MKVINFIYGKNFPSSYIYNLFEMSSVLSSSGVFFQNIIVNNELNFETLNKSMKWETDVPFDGKVEYDRILITSDNIMPESKKFDKLFDYDYDVYTFNDVEYEEGMLPLRKDTAEIPLSCFVMKKGVMESLSEYPWILPSIDGFTDGFMGSIKTDIITVPDIRNMKWY